MEREDVAYLINTTPKYFYLLPLHVGLIRRYASQLKWTIFLATEEMEHPICKELVAKYGVKLIGLSKEDSGFLKSRAAALAALPSVFKYCIPIQEDFLLERFPDASAIRESFEIVEADETVKSIRWMPCPGPSVKDDVYSSSAWRILTPANDEYLFSFQATLWRREVIQEWYERLCAQFDRDYLPHSLTEEQRRLYEIRANYAENTRGQTYFRDWMMGPSRKHLAWTRTHRFPNAVYMSPWPYRPTAVVGGRLEEWAVELGKREGWPLRADNR